MRYLCDNLRAKTIIFEYKLRHLMARVRYINKFHYYKIHYCKCWLFMEMCKEKKFTTSRYFQISKTVNFTCTFAINTGIIPSPNKIGSVSWNWFSVKYHSTVKNTKDSYSFWETSYGVHTLVLWKLWKSIVGSVWLGFG